MTDQPRSGIASHLESLLRRALYTYDLIPESGGITVALSGGKDSLSLLHLLAHVRGRGFPDFFLGAAHVSGAFSCGAGVQVPFLQGTCDRLGVPLAIRETHQTLDELECYSCSRNRRKLLFEMAAEQGTHTVAFGHHRDDNIQTLLMNLLHKGEFAGNLPKLPMVHYGMTIIRPLILAAEEDIRSFAQQMGFARITCQCPVGANSKRRQTEDLLRQLESVFPHARNNLQRAVLRDGSQKALTP
ncbi:MAG: ATP-binding protein [Chlamydiia bacterium]